MASVSLVGNLSLDWNFCYTHCLLLYPTVFYFHYSAHSSWIKCIFGWIIVKYDFQNGSAPVIAGRNTYGDETNRHFHKNCISYKIVSISACGTCIHTQHFTAQRLGTCSLSAGIYIRPQKKWNNLAQDRFQWRDAADTKVSFRIPYTVMNLIRTCALFKFYRISLLHGDALRC